MSYITFIMFLVFAGLALDTKPNEYTAPLSVASFAMLITWALVVG